MDMNPVTLSLEQARGIILHAAGLARHAQFGRGREAVYRLIEHLGFVQLDTNYTVERAHHHVIAARVPDYRLEWLDQLQEEGRIFEFFTSDAGYIPMQDFRMSLPVKRAFLAERKPVTPPETNLMNRVLDRIAREGPLMVKDFENDRQEASAGWWDWRPSKIALERLYLQGKLMTTRTKGFQKIYDLPINLVPDDIDQTMPSPEEFARHVIRQGLRSLGIAYSKEIAWRARFVKGHLVRTELEKMAAEGEICRVTIEDRKTAALYMLSAYRNKKIRLADDAFILSPFDVLNVFRHRLRDFFDFDYQIECFVPEGKRKYGYFSLPVLLGHRFVARMDSKADRKARVLIVQNRHFEKVKLSAADLDKITDVLKAFARFNQCGEIVFKKTNLKQYLKAIRDRL